MTDFTLRNFLHIGRHGCVLNFYCIMLGLLCLVLLTACGVAKPNEDFYVRVTVEATYDGRVVSGSSVIKQPYYKYAPSGGVHGEAVSIDLGGGKRVYMTLGHRQFGRMYASAIAIAFRHIYNPPLKKQPLEEKGKALLEVPYGTKVQWHYKWTKKRPDVRGKYYLYPLLVAFENMDDPASVFLVETERRQRVFGKAFEFKAIYLERVSPDTPLTRKIRNELPWTDRDHLHWPQFHASGGRGNYLCHNPNTKYLDEAEFCERLTRSSFQNGRGG